MASRRNLDLQRSSHTTSPRSRLTLSKINYIHKDKNRNDLERSLVESEVKRPYQKAGADKSKVSLLYGKTESKKEMHISKQRGVSGVMDAIEVVRQHILSTKKSKQSNKRGKRNLEKTSKVDPNWINTVLQFLQSKELKMAIGMCVDNEKVQEDSYESNSSDTTESESQSDLSSLSIQNSFTHPRDSIQQTSPVSHTITQQSAYHHFDRSLNHISLPWMNKKKTFNKKIGEKTPLTSEPLVMCSRESQTTPTIRKPSVATKILSQSSSPSSAGPCCNDRHKQMRKQKHAGMSVKEFGPINPTDNTCFEKVGTLNDNSTVSHKLKSTVTAPVFRPYSEIGYIAQCDTDTQTTGGNICDCNKSSKTNETVTNIRRCQNSQFSNDITQNSGCYRPTAENAQNKLPIDTFKREYRYFMRDIPKRELILIPHNSFVTNEVDVPIEGDLKHAPSDGIISSLHPQIQHNQEICDLANMCRCFTKELPKRQEVPTPHNNSVRNEVEVPPEGENKHIPMDGCIPLSHKQIQHNQERCDMANMYRCFTRELLKRQEVPTPHNNSVRNEVEVPAEGENNHLPMDGCIPTLHKQIQHNQERYDMANMYRYFTRELPKCQQILIPHNSFVRNQVDVPIEGDNKHPSSEGVIPSLPSQIQRSPVRSDVTNDNVKLDYPTHITENYNTNENYGGSPSRSTEAPTLVKSDHTQYSKKVYDSFPVLKPSDQPIYSKEVNHLCSTITNQDEPTYTKDVDSHGYFRNFGSDIGDTRDEDPPYPKRGRFEHPKVGNPQLQLIKPQPYIVDSTVCQPLEDKSAATKIQIKYDPLITDPREQSDNHEEKLSLEEANSDCEVPTSAEGSSKFEVSQDSQTHQTKSRYDLPYHAKQPVESKPTRKQIMGNRSNMPQCHWKTPAWFVPNRHHSHFTSQRQSKTDERPFTPVGSRMQRRKKECNCIPQKSSSVILSGITQRLDPVIPRPKKQKYGLSYASYCKKHPAMRPRQPIINAKPKHSLEYREKNRFHEEGPKFHFIHPTRTCRAKVIHEEPEPKENDVNLETPNSHSSQYAQLAIDMIFRQKEFFQNHLKSLSEICKILVSKNCTPSSNSESDDVSHSHPEVINRRFSKEFINHSVKHSQDLIPNGRKCDRPQSRDISQRSSVTSIATSMYSWREPLRGMNNHHQDRYCLRHQRQYTSHLEGPVKTNQSLDNRPFEKHSK